MIERRCDLFRVLLTAAAYVLMQELRARAAGTGCERAQVSTLRERLLKLGVWVTCSVRRIVLHLPQSTPWRLGLGSYRAPTGRRHRLIEAPRFAAPAVASRGWSNRDYCPQTRME